MYFKSLFKFTLLASFVAFLASCNKEAQMNGELQTKSGSGIVASDLQFVGVQHNQMLAAMYNAFEAADVSSSDGQAFIVDFLQQEISDPSYGYVDDPSSLDLAQQTIADVVNGGNYQTNLLNLYPDPAIEGYLSNEEKVYLDDLYGIIFDNTKTVQEMLNEISALEDIIENDHGFTAEQHITLFSATNVAKASLQYWDQNIDAWVSLGAGKNFKTMGPAGNIAGADVAGAAGGAATAWVVNVVPGAGQVAYGGAILGGAAGGSVAAGVMELWDWAFGD